MQLTGFHHVTAISAQIAENYLFYTRVLGMRLVKRSVNQDDVRAYMWLDFAADSGWRHAEKERNRLAKSMSAQQIVEARQLRQACMASAFRDCE